ncbi:MAG TPA: ion transporter [Cyclobacteriaceae bacterium]|nr:ion transporter [Cyclobacteriaceae bacterium]
MQSPAEGRSLRSRLYNVIFEAETAAGKSFDVALIICILLSIGVIMLESVDSIRLSTGTVLITLEWFFTILFTIEYLVRIWVVKKKRKYILSFYGLVDLISILPTYLSVVLTGANVLLIIRSIRLLRIFRVLKLAQFVGEGQALFAALKASRHKITVFLVTVITSVIIAGTLMFIIEGKENGFANIPISIYWAIVTLTTVGYGDISPSTPLGQAVASLIMILGYGIIAIPTGIVTAEMAFQKRKEITSEVCPGCLKEGHDKDASFCKFCGHRLN